MPDISINMTTNAGQIAQEISGVGQAINNVSSLINGPSSGSIVNASNTPSMQGGSFANIGTEQNALIGDMNTTLREILASIKAISQQIVTNSNPAEQARQLQAAMASGKTPSFFGEMPKVGESGIAGFAAHKATEAMNLVFQGMQIESNYRKDIANENYIGADANRMRQEGSVTNGVMSMIGSGLMFAGPMGILIGLLMNLAGAGIQGYKNMKAGELDASQAEADAFEQVMKHSTQLDKRYGTQSNTINSIKAANIGARDTGLSLVDFLDATVEQSRYGGSLADVRKRTRQAALYSQATGADLSSVQALVGLSSRYGGETDVLSMVSKARQASNMDKSQTEEFLTSMKQIMEEGIANGFVRSSEDVAKNLTMLAIGSGYNKLWTGEQGAKRLQQMNSGLSNATGLSSTSDLIAFQAANDIIGNNGEFGNYIDAMLLLENGVSPSMFANVKDKVSTLYAGDSASQIEVYKQLYGLNYKGASDIYKMTMNGVSEEDIQRKLREYSGNEKYQSEETRKQNILNDLKTQTAFIGSAEFERLLKQIAAKVGGKVESSSQKVNEVRDKWETAGDYKPYMAEIMDNFNGKNPEHKGFDQWGLGNEDYQNELITKIATNGLGNDAKDMEIQKIIGEELTNEKKLAPGNVAQLIARLNENNRFMGAYNGSGEANAKEWAKIFAQEIKNTINNMTLYNQWDNK